MLTVSKKLKKAKPTKVTPPVKRRVEDDLLDDLLEGCYGIDELTDSVSGTQLNHCCGVLEISCGDFTRDIKDFPEVAVNYLAEMMGVGVNEKFCEDRKKSGTAAVVLTDTKRHAVLEAIADTIELGKSPKTDNPLYMWIIRACDIAELKERFYNYGKITKKKRV